MNDSMKAKLEKLSKLTVANGASEAEAETAARMLGKLLADNNLTLEDCTVQAVQDDVEEADPLALESINDWQSYRITRINHACQCTWIQSKKQAFNPATRKIEVTLKVRIVGTKMDAAACRHFVGWLLETPPVGQGLRHRDERLHPALPGSR